MAPSNNSPHLLWTYLASIRVWQIYGGALLYILYRIVRKLYLYPIFLSPLRHVPGPPLGHWLWGQAPAIITAESGILQREWLKKYGDHRGIIRAVGPIGLERIMFLSPEAMHKILVTDWLDYPRPNFMRKILGLTTGFGLLTVTGNRHRQMRRFMNPAFSTANLMSQTDMYYETIYKLVNILYCQLVSGEKHDFLMYPWMSKVTLDIICLTAFGYETNSLKNPDNELASAYEELLNLQNGANLATFVAVLSIPGVTRLIQSKWAWNHRHWFEYVSLLVPLKILMESMHRIKAVSSSILSQKLSEASAISAADSMSKKDIMSLLVRARINEEKSKDVSSIEWSGLSDYQMSDAEMMDQVLTFLGAGHETTASGLSWTLWLLAKHIPAQDRLRKEVSELLDRNSAPDYKALKECQWLDCVIMEALRLIPPVPMTLRRAAKNDWIDGVYVPKGTLFYIPIRVMNQWAQTWGDDAEDFKPERWLNLPTSYHPTFSFQTFITGPHACIGRTMAIIEMKAILSIFITYFSVEPISPNQIAHPTAAITMKPADDLPLRLRMVRPFNGI